MRKNLSLFTFELKMFFKNVINIIFVLIFPSCMILLFGNIYGNNANEMFGGFGTVDIMIPGLFNSSSNRFNEFTNNSLYL